MKAIINLSNFFALRRIVYYETYLSEESLLLGINRYIEKNQNIDGEIYADGFELHYISDFLLAFPTKLPFIEIKGKTKMVAKVTVLRMKTSLNSIMKIFYTIGIGSIILFYLLDKYSGTDYGGISDSILPLMVIPLGYGMSLIGFLLESGSCSDDFERMFNIIEANQSDPEYFIGRQT